MEVASSILDMIPFAAMIMVECTDVGITTISKAAMTKGLSSYVLVVYSNTLGFLFLLPFVLMKRDNLAHMSLCVLSGLFFLGLIGSLSFMMAYAGIGYSSPTLSSALGNLTPVFTFVLAVIFRMERINTREKSSQAKCLGAIVSVSGALLVTLYKGPPILMASLPSNQNSSWMFGGLLLSIANFLAAAWNIVQASIIREFPHKITTVLMYNFFVAIFCAIYTSIVENDSNAWKLKPGIEMIAVLYSGIFGSIFRITVHTWCLEKKGPLFIAMFRPLGIVIAMVMAIIFLGDTLHLGSVAGSIIVAVGFYTVMWAQRKEESVVLHKGTHSQRTSLLAGNSAEIV